MIADYAQVVDRVVGLVNPAYTRTPYEALEATILRTLEAIDADVPGVLVECGVWKGGCSYAMLLAQREAYGCIRRPVWMYDSFLGMSPPVEADGSQAAYWWSGAKDLPKDTPDENFCICPLSVVYEAAQELNLLDDIVFVPGWFNVPGFPYAQPPAIAVLRIDCDWYEPVKACLTKLARLVPNGGSIILDDWHAWEGCVKAVNEYLSERSLAWPINEIKGKNGAWMRVER